MTYPAAWKHSGRVCQFFNTQKEGSEAWKQYLNLRVVHDHVRMDPEFISAWNHMLDGAKRYKSQYAKDVAATAGQLRTFLRIIFLLFSNSNPKRSTFLHIYYNNEEHKGHASPD